MVPSQALPGLSAGAVGPIALSTAGRPTGATARRPIAAASLVSA